MKLLVTGATRFNHQQLHRIEELGHTIFWHQNEKDELDVAYEEIEGIIGNGLFLHHDIQRFSNLKYIQLTSAGFDRVPLDYIKTKQIELHNARGVYSIPMAEFTLMSVLQIYKNAGTFRRNQKTHKWEKQRDLLELYGRNVCIVGCGSVGTECAKRFHAFGCNVYGVDLKPYHSDIYEEMKTLRELKDLITISDVLILTLPLTEDSKHLINKEMFEHIKENAVLINISRGAIVDTKALEDCLKNKNIYAVLDVFENEPLPSDSDLWEMENVYVTPHNSFVGEHNVDRLFKLSFDNLIRWSKKDEEYFSFS